MKTARLYLSGPMRGYPDHNFPAFEQASKALRSQGYDILSPHEHGDPSWSRGRLMAEDLLFILNECDGVACLPNWKESPGACAEVAVAFATEIPVYDVIPGLTYELVPSADVSVKVIREEQYAQKIPLVGLCGYAQSGKDTVAAHLVDNGWERVAFADTLRDMLEALDPQVVIHEGSLVLLRNIAPEIANCWFPGYVAHISEIVGWCGWDDAKTLIPEVRRLLQRLGTEAGRDIIDPDLWVFKGEEKIERSADAHQATVVTDVRFPNELQMIRRRGGTLIWVERPGVKAVNNHASEHSISKNDCDQVIVNDHTIEDLWAKIDSVLVQPVLEGAF